ncbi:MAG: molybdopterin-dependent oxidoreductase, partial [Deltaproteobacteria bacterium]|nr:molybdopterin-dependent oxidoreductase [Deltaproteobacteria bacterium]
MGKVEKLTSGTQGGPVFVYVQDGRIIRITPMNLDENDAASWAIKVGNKTFSPPRKTTISPFSVAMRSMIYSDKRLLYPLKRVDFDPDGNRNCTKRGESGYERISWDEAADIVTSEIKRIKREYGPAAILATPSSHHMWGNIGYRHSAFLRFLNLVGYTYADHNPDSWEGWHWGGMHNWGFSARLGIPEQY